MKILKIVAIILLSLVIFAVVSLVISRIGVYMDHDRFFKYSPFAYTQLGSESTWESDDGRIVFSMNGSSEDGYGTIILNGEEVPIIIEGDPYAVSIRRSDESSEGHISGIPKYRNESKFVVKIDYSTHPDYPDGEKIVFTKVE